MTKEQFQTHVRVALKGLNATQRVHIAQRVADKKGFSADTVHKWFDFRTVPHPILFLTILEAVREAKKALDIA